MIKIEPTERTQRTKERQDRVVALWLELKEQNPDVKKDRIAATIAKELDMTKPGIYTILKRVGIKEFQ